MSELMVDMIFHTSNEIFYVARNEEKTEKESGKKESALKHREAQDALGAALRAEQAAYHAVQADPETRELAEFETLLEQGDTLRRALEAGARRSDDERERGVEREHHRRTLQATAHSAAMAASKALPIPPPAS